MGNQPDGAAAPVAERDPPVDLPEAAELLGCLARLAVLQQLADMGRGIDRAAAAHRIDHGDAEAELAADLAQHRRRAAAAVAEGAIVADDDMGDADRPDHHLVDERFGAFRGKAAVEMLDEEKIRAEPRDLALLDAERGEPERLPAGHEDIARMRLEGQHAGRRAARFGETPGVADQRRMAFVQAIEVAHRQHRAALVGGAGTGMSDDAQSGQGGATTPETTCPENSR